MNLLIYANCQGQELQKIFSHFYSTQFNVIPTRPVQLKSNFNINEKVLESVDIFLYQEIGNSYGDEFSSKSILKFLNHNCIKIKFPSLYFNAYWPNYIKNPVYRPLRSVNTMNSGLMPYGDMNIIKFINEGKSLEDIINLLLDDNFYSKNVIIDCIDQSYNELRERERENKCDLCISKNLINLFQKEYSFKTINHPNAHIYFILIDEFMKLISLKSVPYYDYNIDCSYEQPIYPSVIKALDLKFIDSTYRFKYYFNNRLSFERFIDYYFKHSIGLDIIPNKNSDIPRILQRVLDYAFYSNQLKQNWFD